MHFFFVAELLTQQVVDRSESVAQCNKQNKISAGKCKGNPRSEVLKDVAVWRDVIHSVRAEKVGILL